MYDQSVVDICNPSALSTSKITPAAPLSNSWCHPFPILLRQSFRIFILPLSLCARWLLGDEPSSKFVKLVGLVLRFFAFGLANRFCNFSSISLSDCARAESGPNTFISNLRHSLLSSTASSSRPWSCHTFDKLRMPISVSGCSLPSTPTTHQKLKTRSQGFLVRI